MIGIAPVEIGIMTYPFDRIKIDGYRSLEAVELTSLGQINILVGDNNSGKTSCLEAIALLCDPLNPFQWLGISQRRFFLGRSPVVFRRDLTALEWLFSKQSDLEGDRELAIETEGDAEILNFHAQLTELYGSNVDGPDASQETIEELEESISASSGLELTIKVRTKSDSFPTRTFQVWERERFVRRGREELPPLVKNATIFPAYTDAANPPRLSRAIVERDKDDVVQLLREFDDGILDLALLSTNRSSVLLHIEHESLGFAPLYVFGDGTKRVLAIALTLLTDRPRVLLIDEIETSIHKSALGRVFAWLVKVCQRRNVQLFVTTHSLEAIDAMLGAETETEQIVAFRLGTGGEPLQRFSGDLLQRLRSERGLDVR